jgi:hypothetical protein
MPGLMAKTKVIFMDGNWYKNPVPPESKTSLIEIVKSPPGTQAFTENGQFVFDVIEDAEWRSPYLWLRTAGGLLKAIFDPGDKEPQYTILQFPLAEDDYQEGEPPSQAKNISLMGSPLQVIVSPEIGLVLNDDAMTLETFEQTENLLWWAVDCPLTQIVEVIDDGRNIWVLSPEALVMVRKSVLLNRFDADSLDSSVR